MYLDEAVGQPVRPEELVDALYESLKDTDPPTWG